MIKMVEEQVQNTHVNKKIYKVIDTDKPEPRKVKRPDGFGTHLIRFSTNQPRM